MLSKIFVLLLTTLCISFVVNQSQDLSQAQVKLHDRLKYKDYVINPYYDLNSSQICTGTNFGLSAGRNDYDILRATYSNCVYVDGNLEISNFQPYSSINESNDKKNYAKLDTEYDFSFLDNIREITGYLLVFHTHIRTLRLKNLQIIRGKTLYSSKYSVYIVSNERLEKLDLTKLVEIQRGAVFIADNNQLCHMNEVNWNDIINDKGNNYIQQNGDSSKCKKCHDACCSSNSSIPREKCGCWFPGACQKLSRDICDYRCEGRCYGTGKFDCCHKECTGGCEGPSSKDCVACKKFRVLDTGECVDTCPRIKIVDTITGELTFNPNGMYQFGITCVRSCPKNLFIFQELCVTKCPNETYEEEEYMVNPVNGEKGLRRICKPCVREKCPKTCIVNNDGILNKEDLSSLKDCEILNSNLMIMQNPESPLNQATEEELEVLSNVRVINGFIRIQAYYLKTLDFLRNLEVIRAQNLHILKYALIVSGKDLKTLNLKKLRSIENGDVFFATESLCLKDTINWTSILNRKNSVLEKTFNSSCDDYKCHSACEGCWSTGPNYCQFCKSFKLEDICVENCGLGLVNNRYTYIENIQNRVCKYCHPECKDGCFGPTEYECSSCINYKIQVNSTFKCVNECPSTHYLDKHTKSCLPCANSCFGCRGPEETINDNGCIDCYNALVDNDPDYTIIKCISTENTTCPQGSAQDIVKLLNHPFKNRMVCRKCHNECDECYSFGAKLNLNCIKCKNFHSLISNECVNTCSLNNELLIPGTQTCLPCNQECRFGCKGSNNFECNECRGLKLRLKDSEEIVNSLIKDDSSEDLIDQVKSLLEGHTERRIYNNSTIDIEMTIVESFYKFLKQNPDDQSEDTVFCISHCPSKFPNPDMDFFCTSQEPLKIRGLNDSNSHQIMLILISVSIVAFLLITVFGIGLIMKRLDRKNLKLLEGEKMFFDSKDSDEDDDYEDKEKSNMNNLILIKDYELEKSYMLGHGAFGTVYVGYFKPNDQTKVRVAIKELNAFPTMDDDKIKELENAIINEAMLMASVKHKYCLQLSGLCLAESIKIVTQLIPYGSAVSFLQNYRNKISEKNLLNWSQQIAEGMEYLQSREIVHRDLAARNILIKSPDHIKITDFGLAKILDSQEKAFYAKSNSLLPIKWLAIESIQNRIFTYQSDVWSYGVCLWELFTFCAKPYAEIETINIISYLKKGVRLAQPKIASIDVYAILLKCWLEKPNSRPSFKELSDEFSRMSLDPKSYLSFKSDTGSKFVTINENTESLIQNIQNDSLDGNIYDDEDEDEKNKLYKKSNNNSSISPDEGIDLNSIELSNEQAYRKNNTLSNYNQSLVVFKRNSKLQNDKNKKNDYDHTESNLKKNISFLRKLLSTKPKRLNSQLSTATTSTYMSSLYSESNQVTQQCESLNYEEQQSLLTSSTSQLPTRSNSSNNSSIYNYNSRFRDLNNTNSDYLEPVMHNVKQNFEYFGDSNQKPVASIIIMDKDKSVVSSMTNNNKSPYYNDNLI